MKRARKYEAALAIISHSVIDFLSERIRQYGQALLDVLCYKLLMGTFITVNLMNGGEVLLMGPIRLAVMAAAPVLWRLWCPV